MSRRIFLDASFWIAYRDKRQEHHELAVRIFSREFRPGLLLVTTLPVICEVHAFFSRGRAHKRMVLDDFFGNPVVTIAEISPKDQQEALWLLQEQGDKSFSLCDALSSVVMKRLQVRQVMAFDDHFRQVGEFDVLS